MLDRICVFCGSNAGARAAYRDAASELGTLLAKKRIGIVYGGSNVGLMGLVADAALRAGGEVIGVIPQALADKEVAHDSLSDLRVVASMHERKAMMADFAAGFITLPGGFGTFDELCEILSWAQLGLHRKPVCLLNIEGYFNPFLQMLDHAVAEKFLRPEHRAMLLEASSPAAVLESMSRYHAVATTKWITREET